MHSQQIEYQAGDITLKGYYSVDKKISGKRPAVLVVSDWSGCNEFAWKKAEKLAELGYVGFAVVLQAIMIRYHTSYKNVHHTVPFFASYLKKLFIMAY